MSEERTPAPPAPAAPASPPPEPAATVAPAAPLPVEETAAPSPAEAPTPEAPPPTEVAPVETPAETVPPKSLLAEAIEAEKSDAPKPEEKPAEGAPQEAAKPAYEPFTLPEGVQLDPALMTGYTDVLGTHGIKQEAGQALLDLHLNEMQRLATHYENEQRRVFQETVSGWRTETMADEVLGGAGHQTAMQGVMRAIDRLTAGNEAHRTSLLQTLEYSGLADHPAVLRAFYNMDRILAQPAPVATTAIKPTPDRGGVVRGRQGRSQVLYDNTPSFGSNGTGR